MRKKIGITKYEKNEKNPFIEKAIEEVNSSTVRKYKHASGQNQKAILQAVNAETGELMGHTTFVKQIEVDEEKFTKFYLSNFSAFYDLTKAGIKVLGYILSQTKANQDRVEFDIDKCLKHTGYSTKDSIYRGLSELLESEIIARTRHDIFYYINPLVVFNGNRITYVKSYVKKQKPSNPSQLELF